jgi:hypothetical protein
MLLWRSPPRTVGCSPGVSNGGREAAHGSSGGGGGLKVVADGLDNPRGIGFGPDGALYVAESGSGGPSALATASRAPRGGEACFGRTGVAASGPVDLGFSGWTGHLLVGNPVAAPRPASSSARRADASASCSRSTARHPGRGRLPEVRGGNNPDGGAGIPPGKASVFRVVSGHDPEGQLPTGRLVRINRDGSQKVLVSEGLGAPGGFVLGHGAAYITNDSILSDAGQVVKVDL